MTTMGTPILRKLRPEEFGLAHSILVSAAEWLISKGIRQWTTAYPKETYLACQEKGWNYGLMSDGQLMVIVTLSCGHRREWADCVGTTSVWWLSKLATAPGCHGLGLGAHAVRQAISALSAQGADRLYLDCVHGTGFLVDFYRGLGFETVARRNVQFPTGLFDMVLMELKLPVEPSFSRSLAGKRLP
jgi:GNAT superfamily N-acetyltransferase